MPLHLHQSARSSYAGRPFFTLAAAAISMRDKRQLLDAYNQPLVHMEKKMLSLHNSWLMVDPRSGRKLAEVKPSLMSLTPCKCQVLQRDAKGGRECSLVFLEGEVLTGGRGAHWREVLTGNAAWCWVGAFD